MKWFPILLLAFSMLLINCQDSELESIDRSEWGYDYMPLEVGAEWDYLLDSIIYDPEPAGIEVDTLSYHMKLIVADTFLDGQGDKAYLIERYLRTHDTLPWKIRNIWSMKMTDSKLIWSEGNLDYIKLSFPLRNGVSWDGNTLFSSDDAKVNIRGEQLDMFKFWNSYRVENRGGSMQIAGSTYNDVVTISHVDREILIEKRLSLEVYAKDLGLVYKRMEILDTQNDNTSIPFKERAEKGFILEMSLIR
jgi:hypothetical protein